MSLITYFEIVFLRIKKNIHTTFKSLHFSFCRGKYIFKHSSVQEIVSEVEYFTYILAPHSQTSEFSTFVDCEIQITYIGIFKINISDN